MSENVVREIMKLVEEWESSEKSEFILELLQYVELLDESILVNVLQRQQRL